MFVERWDMNIFRKIFLTLAIALVVLCYGYPMFVLPVGNYKYSYKSGEETKTATLTFRFDGSYSLDGFGASELTGYYKVKNGKLFFNDTKDFSAVDEEDGIKITNVYELTMDVGTSSSWTFENAIGKYTMLGVGVLSLLLVLTIPSSKRRD